VAKSFIVDCDAMPAQCGNGVFHVNGVPMVYATAVDGAFAVRIESRTFARHAFWH
jgi:hypothetical protein